MSFAAMVSGRAASDHAHLGQHLLAHFTMLHGMIPNRWLPYSEYAFNSPAWSISLEWQFYLVAPLVVMIMRERLLLLIGLAALLTAADAALKMFGPFTEQPAMLPMAVAYFGAGIASRIVFDRIQHLRWLVIALMLAIVFSPMKQFWPFLVWLIVLSGLSLGTFADLNFVETAYRRILENRVVLYLGSRSYSIYLCHYPVLSVTAWLWFHHAGAPANMVRLAILTPPLIMLAAEMTYRTIELPGMALGRRVAALLPQRSRTRRVVLSPGAA
ncbi:MAG: acyltransferase [Nocardiopsaceae bacterium]|jgi:peptidoglycan/LPS O-acetylase OafA/YrhL|nr:acyltransferase [Nocardiopsaceae bacterium]